MLPFISSTTVASNMDLAKIDVQSPAAALAPVHSSENAQAPQPEASVQGIEHTSAVLVLLL